MGDIGKPCITSLSTLKNGDIKLSILNPASESFYGYGVVRLPKIDEGHKIFVLGYSTWAESIIKRHN
ncbi:hypothetical protein AYI70_g496 [Smittium culicis]|uniref:Uncharacterized protein n=1 Tax=Smittium culicis TaxID=133412 RepID=A0A1R1YGK3_9FUNG|nr:hypothetical protein AYI70_g496 [Smittium culicis]